MVMRSGKQSFQLTRELRTCAAFGIALIIAFPLTGCSRGGQPQVAAENQNTQVGGGHEGLLVAREQVPGHLASMTGLVTMRNGCVMLDNGRTGYVLVWPAGTEFTSDRRTIVVPQDDGTRAAYTLGRNYTLAGGGMSRVDGSTTGFEPPGNAACQGQAWAVSTTRPRNGAIK